MFVITKWCACITDSGKDEHTGKKLKAKNVYRFRLLDDDGIVYAYGLSDDDSDFEPLDRYMDNYGVTGIQYKNNQGVYEYL